MIILKNIHISKCYHVLDNAMLSAKFLDIKIAKNNKRINEVIQIGCEF